MARNRDLSNITNLPAAKGDIYTASADNTPAVLAASTEEGAALVADSSATVGLRWQGNYAAGKNRIINGAMLIDQRNSGVSVTINSDGFYTLDRWLGSGQSSDGVYTVQQDSDVPEGFSKSAKITVTTADASIGASQSYQFETRVEGQTLYDFDLGKSTAKTFTMSFWVRSSVTGTFGGAFRNSALNRSYPFTYTISSANTWEKKSVTVVGDTTGTWLTTTGVGLRIGFNLGEGSNGVGTAGAWAGANYRGATGQTNLISTLNATWYITGIQLEIGSVATGFAHAGGTIQGELAACQRYYQRINPNSQLKILGNGFANATTQARSSLSTLVPMRIAPTALEQSGTATDYEVLSSGTTLTTCSAVPTFASATQYAIAINFTVASGLTAGHGLQIRTATSDGYLGWSAEL